MLIKLYLLYFILSGVTTIYIYTKNKIIYTIGEILSLFCIIAIFMIYLNYVNNIDLFMFLIIFLYILFWEFYINLNQLILFFKTKNIPIEKNLFKVSLFVSLLFMLPFFYMVVDIVKRSSFE